MDVSTETKLRIDTTGMKTISVPVHEWPDQDNLLPSLITDSDGRIYRGPNHPMSSPTQELTDNKHHWCKLLSRLLEPSVHERPEGPGRFSYLTYAQKLRANCNVCPVTLTSKGSVHFGHGAVDVYGDAIGAFFDNCLASMYCSLADRAVYTKSCWIKYNHAAPVDKVLCWMAEVVGSDKIALKEQASGRIKVRGRLVDYDQLKKSTGEVFAESELLLTLRAGATWGTSAQADQVIEQAKLPLPKHEIIDNPSWPVEAALWEKWLSDRGFVEVDHSWVDEALLSAYKQQPHASTNEALSLFEFSQAKKLKLRSFHHGGNDDLACLIHFTNYSCGPEKRIHGGAIIAAVAKAIGLRVHLPKDKQSAHLKQVSALQVNFLSGVLQDSVGLVTTEETSPERCAEQSRQPEVTITASLRSLLRDENKQFPTSVGLDKTKLCATCTGTWLRKSNSRI